MSLIPPSTANFRGGRYVKNGVAVVGDGKPLTAAEIKKIELESEEQYAKWFRRTHPEAGNIIVQRVSLNTATTSGGTRISNLLKRTPPTVYPLQFALLNTSTLDATGKNTYPATQIIQDIESALSEEQTDHIDVAFFRWPTSETLVDETLGAYARLQQEGKILALGGMDLSAAELTNILSVADAKGLPGYQVLAVNYNFYDRSIFEGPLQDLVVKENIAALPYTSLASGFLTGKYRTLNDLIDNPLSAEIANYFTPRGFATLDALAQVAAKYSVPSASVALAWLMNQPGVTTPMIVPFADAEEEEQVTAAAVNLTLSAEDIALLAKAGQ
ncbi:aldo/keto reductase [Kosakonia radicincitans]|uniref:aldo/keto reductase n=1 Tax=Kosakonia radicincitans TaxID=283686 RepID=UPI0005C30DD9|nr:aldo/keto reductase [Kosakonia radicincitans]KIS45717.1 aldo/keto reductase family protein [Kosakonia radicincitans YD4]